MTSNGFSLVLAKPDDFFKISSLLMGC